MEDCKLSRTCKRYKTDQCNAYCYPHVLLHGTDGKGGFWATRNVPKKYSEYLRDNLPAQEENPKIFKAVINYIDNILERVQKTNRGIYFCENTGTGKTTIPTISIMLVEGNILPKGYVKFDEPFQKTIINTNAKSEYAQYPTYSTKINPTEPLFIETYEGGNEPMHPKVLYFKDGWNGWKYWITYNPYTGTNDYIENACIGVSNNGIHWETPKGLINPLATTPDHTLYYNSDQHLVYNTVTLRLECWYRRAYDSVPKQEIYRRTSLDGVTWEDEELLHSYIGDIHARICPVILFTGTKYQIWTSGHAVDTDPRGVYYFESTDGYDWVQIRQIMITGVTDISHFDIVKTPVGYELIFMPSTLLNLQCAYSTDNITYSTPKVLITRGVVGSWDDNRMYRPSITFINGTYWVYYSATSVTGHWGTGLIKLDNMYPSATAITTANTPIVPFGSLVPIATYVNSFSKTGNTATLNFGLKISGTSEDITVTFNTGLQIATIPTGYIPPLTAMSFAIGSKLDGSSVILPLQITSTGVIMLYTQGTTNTTCKFVKGSISYSII